MNKDKEKKENICKSLKESPQISHLKKIIKREDNESYFTYLFSEIPFTEVKYKNTLLKRLIHRIDLQDFILFPTIQEIVKIIEINYKTLVNGIFCNLYRNGKDYTPYHSDSYKMNVITISFGGTRDFLTKAIKDIKSTYKTIDSYKCEDGDIIYFNSAFNDIHKHSIPIRSRILEPRISLVLFCSSF